MAAVRLTPSRVFLARRVQAQLAELPQTQRAAVELCLENLGALLDARLPTHYWSRHPRHDDYFVADVGNGLQVYFDVDAGAGVILVARLEGPGVPTGSHRIPARPFSARAAGDASGSSPRWPPG